MRVIVFAYSQLGHDCLKLLLNAGEDVAGVFTHTDSPTEHRWFESVEGLARSKQIPVYTPSSPNTPEVIQEIRRLKPDIIFSFYYRHMICQEILDIPPLGALNMHGSLLPKYRGRCPLNWAIIGGEDKTGATLHYMVKSADAGDIVDQEAVSIEKTETAGVVMAKVNEAAQAVLRRQLGPLKMGTALRQVQDHSLSSYFGGRGPKDGEIHWKQSALQIHNLIRALQPYPQYPPAFTVLGDEQVWMMESLPLGSERFLPLDPGYIVSIDGGVMEVACGDTGAERLHITKACFKGAEVADVLSKVAVGQVFGHHT